MSTDGIGESLWQACVDQLAQELSEQQFNTWIKPLTAQVADDLSRMTVFVANRFKLDWIRAQYAGKIAAMAEKMYGQPVAVELALAPREAPVRSAPVAVLAETDVPRDVAGPGEEPANAGFKNRLNSGLTFDTLVEGTANRMARAAAMHVAGMPGHLYNPLFIYGGVGLGKTHLMHAVGNRLLADRPDSKVLYIHAEQFVSDVVKAYQRKTFDEFKERYHSLDLLLIDDVQFFANKDRTQEEFFNAFEALLAKKSHIVMTSDTYPKGLADIHERLVSRFDSGLTVAIEPPELEMRVAILINKARAESAEMPEEVAFFVAKNVRSNVRELEGALRKILAYSRFNQKEISIALAREALRDLLSIQNRQISVENIQKTVADYYKIKVADMYSKKRPASIARPRQIAMYLAKELTQKSLPEIGELFGGRDHDGAARGAQDLGRAPAAHRAQPAAARARADAQGLIPDVARHSPRNSGEWRLNGGFKEIREEEEDMIVLKATQDKVLAALQSVAGIVERRHTLPILANVLIRKTGGQLQLTTSDLEIQIRTTAELGGDEGNFTTTIGARKLIDILRTMPADQTVSLESSASKLVLKGGKSRFTLQSLPAEDFPLVQEAANFGPVFSVPQKTLKDLLSQVSFAMAVHDIRYYLNGILFVAEGKQLSLVATDGHRLAFSSATLDVEVPRQEVILPRKTVLEMQRLLSDAEGAIEMQFANNQAKFSFGGMEFVTKLVEGKFPDYNRVIPKNHKNSVTLGRAPLLASLQRTAILTSEKFKGVRLNIEPGTLRIASNNAEQEEAQDELDIDYGGDAIEIGFNVTYLIDALSNMDQDMVKLDLADSNSSALLTIPENASFKYVVMPMRI